jgi:hypothetical protein
MTASQNTPTCVDTDEELPPGLPVVGNDAPPETVATEPLDDAPIPPLTEPGDTNGG